MSTTINIPSQQTSQTPIILIADPKIIAVPVKENHEPLIDLTQQTDIIYGPSPEIDNNTCYTKLRKTVYDKLKQAQNQLPKGIRFCLYEGYRSLSLQEILFNERYTRVQNSHPHWPREQLFIETIKMVSPIINLDGSINIPPHATGAAADVYLIDENGIALEMGIHPKDWLQDTEDKLSPTHATEISKTAKKNRQLMAEVLIEVGFVNYPTEYWHWSYGDRYWAYHQQQPYAIYDIIKDNHELITK